MTLFVLRNDNNLGRVKQGLFHALKSLDLDKPKQVTISDYKEGKTGEQRAFFHALCKLFGDELGYTQAEIKEYAKQEALGVKTVTIGGVTKEITRSSESAKRDEYSALIEAVYRLAAQAGIQLPMAWRA